MADSRGLAHSEGDVNHHCFELLAAGEAHGCANVVITRWERTPLSCTHSFGSQQVHIWIYNDISI